MLREIYIAFILLNVLYFDIKLCFQCSENSSTMVKIACKITKFKKSVVSYVNTELLKLENTRQRVKNGLIRFYEDLKNDSSVDNGTKPGRALVLRDSQLRTTVGMNAEELIIAHGYKAEAHHIYTDDGYMLTIHRMLLKQKLSQKLQTGSVLLHHGLFGSSEDWLLLDTSLTLPYLLLKYGFDVWLLNARGNKYTSVPFARYTRKSTYREFSWHEMGIYDLPATITYITKYANGTNLYYIGYSLGTTALLVLLSSIPEYNNKLKAAIFLAPLAFMSHTTGPLKILAELSNSTYDYMENGEIPQEIKENFCEGTYKSCSNSLLFIANGGKLIQDYKLMESILNHVPAKGSTKTIAHYMQLIKSGRFQVFDYGPQNNIQKYNVSSPPNYNLKAITLPISVFTSSGDWLSTISDTMTLLNKLENVKNFHIVRKENFTHLDFIWSKEATQFVFNEVMNILIKSSDIEPVTNSLTDIFNEFDED